jgi:thioredoxin reductase (NADPH)
VEGARLFENRTGERREVPLEEIVAALGFQADAGPVRNWGLELEGGAIRVNSRMETNLPGIYAAGDMVTYDGKLKLIATGVSEAAIAVNHAKAYIDPASRAYPGHSSDIVKEPR